MNLVSHSSAPDYPQLPPVSWLPFCCLFCSLSISGLQLDYLPFERDWSIQHEGMLRWTCRLAVLHKVKEINEKTDLAKGIQEMAVLLSPSVPAAGDFISISPVSVEVFQAFQISFLSPLQSFSFCFAILNSNYATELYPLKRMCNMHGQQPQGKGHVEGSPRLPEFSSIFPNNSRMK